MNALDLEQGSDEWKAARAGRATASKFACVLAKVKSGEAAVRRNYRAQLVVERLTGRPVASFETPAMRQGTEREPIARAAYEVKTGAFVDEVGFILHDTIGCGASPDGLVGDDGCIEIKCPELAAHLETIQTAGAPPEHIAQIQGVMWLAERQWCDFISFNPDFPEHLQMVVRRIARDDIYITGLALAVELFMGEVLTEESAVLAMPDAA